MVRAQHTVTILTLAALLAACGNSGGSGGTTTVAVPTTGPTSSPSPTPTPSAVAGCTLRDRQDWAAAQLREWYLFPESLPAALDPTPYTTVEGYIDALTATARAQRKDRYFTYLTSIATENAYYASGASAGFGFRLSYDTNARRVFVAESFEGTAATAAGVDRGAEIIAIGASSDTLATVDSILATQGTAGITDALGPGSAGTVRVLRVTDTNGTRTVSLTKTDYALTPVSSRYGVQILTDGGRQIGYVNLRTFISTADPALRAAFARFKAAGITDVIVDLRYNGGGSLAIAELLGNLLGGARSASDVLQYTTFRPEKAASNVTAYYTRQPETITPTRIAFIGTGGTASASELVIAQAIPYLHSNAALIGTNTYGKPVGQIALDRAQCDDRLRVVALSVQNAARQGAYYDGLATIMEANCRADDDFTHPLGDPQETSTRTAIDYLAGRSCTPFVAAAGTQTTLSLRTATPSRALLIPDHPDTTQREVPGSF